MTSSQRRAFDLWRSRQDLLVGLTAAAAVAIAIGRLVLLNVAELFPGGSRLGELVYDLAIAYVASYLFYLLVVAGPRLRLNRKIAPGIVTTIDRVIVQDRLVLDEIGFPYTVDNYTTFADPDIVELCRTTDLAERVERSAVGPNREPIAVTISKWQSIAESVDLVHLSLDRLVPLLPFLDAELIGIVDELEHCGLFSLVRHWRTFETNSRGNLSGMARLFVEYHDLVRRLYEYGSRLPRPAVRDESS